MKKKLFVDFTFSDKAMQGLGSILYLNQSLLGLVKNTSGFPFLTFYFMILCPFNQELSLNNASEVLFICKTICRR